MSHYSSQGSKQSRRESERDSRQERDESREARDSREERDYSRDESRDESRDGSRSRSRSDRSRGSGESRDRRSSQRAEGEEEVGSEEGEEEQVRRYRRKKKRRSLGNPRIKPSKGSKEHSTLDGLAKQTEEKNKKDEEFNDPATEIFQPKNNFINLLIGQHLLSSGYEKAAKQLEVDSRHINKFGAEKIELNKVKNLKASCFQALKNGNQKEFFESRGHLHEELNYYQLDFDLSLELEMKTRVYFAFYLLSQVEEKNLNIEDAKRQTQPRMEELKSFFVEHGADFAEDDTLKEYLKLPYVVDKMPGDNKTLNFVLSEDFTSQIEAENHRELERVVFYANEVTRHRSFITKLYEFYTKYHSQGSSQMHREIYEEVEEMLKKVQREAVKYDDEGKDIENIKKKILDKMKLTKERHREKQEEQEKKEKAIYVDNLGKDSQLSITQMSKQQRDLNLPHMKDRSEALEAIRDLKEAVRGERKLEEDLPSEKAYWRLRQKQVLLRTELAQLQRLQKLQEG